jgi:hypothetical protein
MKGDEKSEAIMGAWEIVAAGSGLNAMLGGRNGISFGLVCGGEFAVEEKAEGRDAS